MNGFVKGLLVVIAVVELAIIAYFVFRPTYGLAPDYWKNISEFGNVFGH